MYDGPDQRASNRYQFLYRYNLLTKYMYCTLGTLRRVSPIAFQLLCCAIDLYHKNYEHEKGNQLSSSSCKEVGLWRFIEAPSTPSSLSLPCLNVHIIKSRSRRDLCMTITIPSHPHKCFMNASPLWPQVDSALTHGKTFSKKKGTKLPKSQLGGWWKTSSPLAFQEQEI